jgi:predicted RNA-binding protein with PIN domain
MRLLVDGYNLLHASGQFGSPSDPPTLETARRALLEYLTQQLTERERSRATIVFDGKDAPPGLPAVTTYEKTTADQLIAEMIAAEKAPRELRVISSDHAVQRAARQRGVAFADSEVWLRELRQKIQQQESPAEKSEPAQSAADVEHWLREFSPPPPHVTKTTKNKNKPRGKS